MNEEMEIGTPFNSWDGGASFKGVGDSEVESHFTFVEGEGYHASTYLDLGFPEGKSKVDQYDIDG